MKRLADLSTISEAEWLDLRRRGIGSSDAAAVLGVSPWSSPFALYADKLGLLEPRPESEAMRWGKILEPVIATEYARETGRAIEDPRILAQHDDHEFVLATPDRFAIRTGGERIVVEIKTSRDAEGWSAEPPAMYLVQVQHLLAVTGYGAGSLVVLVGGQRLLWTDLDRNERFITALLAAEREFWRRVELRDPPPVDGMEATTEAIRALYPRDSGITIALPASAADLDQRRVTLKDRIATAEAELAEVENGLKSLLGDATRGVIPGGGSYTWKLERRAEHTIPAREFRVLRRSEKG